MKSRPTERPLRRAKGTKAEKQRVLVYCEGANTEEIYLKGIKRELRDRPISIVVGPADGEPMALVRDAIKHRNPAREAGGGGDDREAGRDRLRFDFPTLWAGRARAGARAQALHARHARLHPDCRENPCTSMPDLLAALGL